MSTRDDRFAPPPFKVIDLADQPRVFEFIEFGMVSAALRRPECQPLWKQVREHLAECELCPRAPCATGEQLTRDLSDIMGMRLE